MVSGTYLSLIWCEHGSATTFPNLINTPLNGERPSHTKVGGVLLTVEEIKEKKEKEKKKKEEKRETVADIGTDTVCC